MHGPCLMQQNYKENQAIFTKPKDLTDPKSKLPKKLKPKNNIKKDNLETYLHLVKKLMDEAPEQDINDTIMEMKEHFDLREFYPFW